MTKNERALLLALARAECKKPWVNSELRNAFNAIISERPDYDAAKRNVEAAHAQTVGSDLRLALCHCDVCCKARDHLALIDNEQLARNRKEAADERKWEMGRGKVVDEFVVNVEVATPVRDVTKDMNGFWAAHDLCERWNGEKWSRATTSAKLLAIANCMGGGGGKLK